MNEDQIRAAFEKAHPNYGGKAWIMLEGTLAQESFVKGYKAAISSQVNNVLPNQEPLGSDFEKVLFDNLDSLYETATAPQPTNDRVRELEALVDKLLEADMTAQLNGGGAYARHTVPAILELRKFRAKQRQAMKEANQ